MKRNIVKYLSLALILSFLAAINSAFGAGDSLVVDSDMTLEEALKGSSAPREVLDAQRLLDVYYYGFDGKLHKGQLVVHESVESDVEKIFAFILEVKFPVKKAVPISAYDWSDGASMQDDNTSAFNYRFIAGTKRLSNHAFGKAVDINPRENPVVYSDGRISPSGAAYDPTKAGTFSADHPVVQKFIELGWRWGGMFSSFKDFHHFDKNP